VPVPLTTYTCRLTQAQAQAIQSWMRARDFTWREVPYARFAGEKGKLNLVLYEDGKLVVQGRRRRSLWNSPWSR
jgi:ribonuclease HIII